MTWDIGYKDTNITVSPPTNPGVPVFSGIRQTVAIATWAAAISPQGIAGYETNLNNAGWVDQGLVLTQNLSGLSLGSIQSLQVRAYDVNGVRGPASAASFTTLPLPSAPPSLTFSAIAQTTATAAWGASTAPQGIGGYEGSLNGAAFVDLGNVLTENLAGLTSGASETVAVRAYDVFGVRGPATTNTFTTTLAPPTGAAVAQFALWAGTGAQLPNAAHWALWAQFPIGLLGGDFPSAVGPGSGVNATRDQVLSGIIGSVVPASKTAIQQQTFQYQNLPNFNLNATNQLEWANKAAANNWLLYLNGSSGAKQTTGDVVGGSYAMPAHGGGNGGSIAAIAVDPATGLWPYEYAIQYMHDRYIGTGLLAGGTLATGTSLAVMGSQQLAGLWVDNPTSYLRVPGDWDRSGINRGTPGTGEATTMAAVLAGQADLGKQFRVAETKAGTNRKIIGNTAQFATVSYGINGAPMNQAFDYTMQQFAFGRGISAQWQYHGFAYILARYQELCAAARSGSGFMSAQYQPGDIQAMRHDYLFTLLKNGYLFGGVSAGGDSDYVDPNNPATYMLIDEFWGGTLNLGGFLGPWLNTPQGQPQTAPWQGSIYRRDATNGIVLVNSDTIAHALTLETTFWHLHSNLNAQAINSGLPTTGFTLGTFSYESNNSSYNRTTTTPSFPFTMGDCCILLRSAPP